MRDGRQSMRLLTAGSLVRAQLEEPHKKDTMRCPFCVPSKAEPEPSPTAVTACEAMLLPQGQITRPLTEAEKGREIWCRNTEQCERRWSSATTF